MGGHKLRLLIIGAHPDDADYHAGGTAALYRAAGHVVKMLSVTNGNAGHHLLAGDALVQRRRQEAAAAGAIIGATYEVWDTPDGCLLPTLELRLRIIRLLRTFQPDLVLTHRPYDYQPDHRYTSQLVQDAAYMVTVPAIAPDTPPLAGNPVIAYLPDAFSKPCLFEPTIVVDVEPVLDRIVNMLECHASQFFEWLPYNHGYAEAVPAEPVARRSWLTQRVAQRLQEQAARFRVRIDETYGPDRSRGVQLVEAFEACEYGAPLDDAARRRLFPFVF